ncbi:MAG: hypothetical protein RJA49_614 [Actinomycetota bacterium]
MGMNVAIVEGRPLRGWHGRVQLARARLGHSHLTDQSAMRLAHPLRQALADHWRLQGELEHSSVVAYQDLARRLALLDAPDDLVHRCLVAAQQEGAHGVRCFELAGRYLGQSMHSGRLRRPLRLPRSRSAELQALAVQTLLDGVVLEAYASRMARIRAQRAFDSRVVETLQVIATDEAVHAVLARDILDWCLGTGGQPVRVAVRQAALQLPVSGPGIILPVGLDHGVLADHGQYDADPDNAVFRELTEAARELYLARTQS